MRGRTVRWSFQDGATAGTTYEHRFGRDGSIEYRALDGIDGSFTAADAGTVMPTGPGVVTVSYLGHSGYTLTTVLDLRARTMVGFASNGQEWSMQRGAFEILRSPRGAAKPSRRRARAHAPRRRTAPHARA